jgi:hypothetical protein
MTKEMDPNEPWDAKALELGIEVRDDFPFYVVEDEDDHSMTFYWDSEHPTTSVFNTWTEQDFSDMLIQAAKEKLAEFDESEAQ